MTIRITQTVLMTFGSHFMKKMMFYILLFVTNASFAAQPLPILKVISEEWQDYTNADGTGTYWDIVKAVYGQDYQLEFITSTWSIALNAVESGRADILVGTYNLADRKLAFPHHHIDMEYPIYAIYDANAHHISAMDDLAGLTVAGKKGYDLQSFLPSSSYFYGVDYIDDIALLIERKRIDVALTYQVNLPLADPESRYAHKEIGAEEPLYIAFTLSAKGQALRTHFDQKIKKLIANKQLVQYFHNKQEYQHARLNTRVLHAKPSSNAKHGN